MTKLATAALAVVLVLSVAGASRADDAEYVASMFAQLKQAMGVQPSDPDYCEKSRDLCAVMCERFVSEGMVSGGCEMHCDAAVEEACQAEE